jgi:predicted small lipoprotein YifL
MLLKVRKKRILLTSLCSILLISGCGLKGPLYQTPKDIPKQEQSTITKLLTTAISDYNAE